MRTVPASYTTLRPFRSARPGVLVIYCSDGRFTAAVEELLEQIGHGTMDRLSVPGGPAALSYTSSGYSERDAATRACTFLIKEHSINQIVLVAHEGCALYRQRHPNSPAADIKRRQLEDLQGAAKALVRIRSGLTLLAYFAHVNGGHVTFEAVELS
jgi:hypothetical protein